MTDPSVPQKRCANGDNCAHPMGPVLPATTEYFYASKSNKFGVATKCIVCKRKEQRVINATPERRAYMRAYGRTPQNLAYRNRWAYEDYHKPDKIAKKRDRARERARRPDVRAQRKAYMQQWRGRPEYRAYVTAYYRSPRRKETQRHYARLRRARRLNAPGTFTRSDIRLQYKSQKGLCWWCEQPLHNRYHIDHRVPLSRGGSNDPRNLCLACPRCNRSKNAKMPHEWIGRLL